VYCVCVFVCVCFYSLCVCVCVCVCCACVGGGGGQTHTHTHTCLCQTTRTCSLCKMLILEEKNRQKGTAAARRTRAAPNSSSSSGLTHACISSFKIFLRIYILYIVCFFFKKQKRQNDTPVDAPYRKSRPTIHCMFFFLKKKQAEGHTGGCAILQEQTDTCKLILPGRNM